MPRTLGGTASSAYRVRAWLARETTADQSQVGTWPRAQLPASVTALRDLLREFVAWVWAQAAPRRLLHAGQREIFFDDSQLEVRGAAVRGRGHQL